MERLAKIAFFVGLVIYFVFSVISRVPAQWGAQVALQNAPGLTLGAVSGSLWSGKAASATINVQGQTIDLGGLSWDVDVWALLGLNVCADITSRMIQADVCRSLAGMNRVDNLMLETFPAKMLDPIISFARLGGDIGITVKHLQVTDDGKIHKISANAFWDGARGEAGGGWFELGGFNADLKENGQGGVVATIVDTAGGFGLQMDAEYGFGGEYKADGIITPRPEANSELVVSLGLFTETLDDGTFRLKWPM